MSSLHSFYLTLEECKFKQIPPVIKLGQRFYLTLEECKYKFQYTVPKPTTGFLFNFRGM